LKKLDYLLDLNYSIKIINSHSLVIKYDKSIINSPSMLSITQNVLKRVHKVLSNYSVFVHAILHLVQLLRLIKRLKHFQNLVVVH